MVHAGYYFRNQMKCNRVAHVLSPFVSLDKLKIWTLREIDWALSLIPRHLVEHCVILEGPTITCHLNSDSDVRSECINFGSAWCTTRVIDAAPRYHLYIRVREDLIIRFRKPYPSVTAAKDCVWIFQLDFSGLKSHQLIKTLWNNFQRCIMLHLQKRNDFRQ